MSTHNEAYVTITLKVTVPVSYKGDAPTGSECVKYLEEYVYENDPDFEGVFEVVGIEVDEDSVLKDMED